ncbi:MAG: ribbon-helix-helix protein, CopG family [Mycobacterium sp.]|uniref:ribbon-helix-helix protein, CopG family n=1 Tax=Mycobacterium sp. TaxID=1785 RepID=UPI003F956030
MAGGGRGRVDAGELARRVNAAADLLEAGMAVAEATRTLADRFGCSVRQARRYVEQAGADGRVDVPEVSTVFTVRLPVELVARVRQRARESGSTISALVTQALTEFLARGHRKRPRR